MAVIKFNGANPKSIAFKDNDGNYKRVKLVPGLNEIDGINYTSIRATAAWKTLVDLKLITQNSDKVASQKPTPKKTVPKKIEDALPQTE